MVYKGLLIKTVCSVPQKMCSKFVIASCLLNIRSGISSFQDSANKKSDRLGLIPLEGAWSQLIAVKVENIVNVIVVFK